MYPKPENSAQLELCDSILFLAHAATTDVVLMPGLANHSMMVCNVRRPKLAVLLFVIVIVILLHHLSTVD